MYSTTNSPFGKSLVVTTPLPFPGNSRICLQHLNRFKINFIKRHGKMKIVINNFESYFEAFFPLLRNFLLKVPLFLLEGSFLWLSHAPPDGEEIGDFMILFHWRWIGVVVVDDFRLANGRLLSFATSPCQGFVVGLLHGAERRIVLLGSSPLGRVCRLFDRRPCILLLLWHVNSVRRRWVLNWHRSLRVCLLKNVY